MRNKKCIVPGCTAYMEAVIFKRKLKEHGRIEELLFSIKINLFHYIIIFNRNYQ